MSTQDEWDDCYGQGVPARSTPTILRPHKRGADGFPTRSSVEHWTPAELAIVEAMRAVEDAGASPALTDAINLLQRARDRVADHVEGIA